MALRFTLAATLLCAAAFAGAPALAIDERLHGNVRYITGGVGEDEKQELLDRVAQYTLRITTAVRKSGDFLADCKVTVTRGTETVLEAVMDGPVLMARLEPGPYRVRVEFEGRPQDRQITIGRGGMVSLYFYWE